MSNRKGIFTQPQEKFLAQVLDDFFVFNNGLLEMGDYRIFLFIIKTLDNKALDLLKNSWKSNIIKLVDAAMTLDLELTRKIATQILSTEISIPDISSAAEYEVFDAFTKFLTKTIVWYVDKHK